MTKARPSADPAPTAAWAPADRPLGRGDALALLAWTAAVAVAFWDAATLRGALFYFDITEINFAYRDFLARELAAGRFSRWMPGLYCGLPLYSESQAGYLHPLKLALYPWMSTWKALNLDTVGSVWLTGLGAYAWLRRHVGAVGALSGAATFGLGGFTWAHLIHTSMTNALASVPVALWGLERSWDRGRLGGVAVAGLALACQVFAGHLQDVILTGSMLGLLGLHRAATARGAGDRLFALGATAGALGLGVLISAVQWLPSKELLDRSPRSEGLSFDKLTFGSWHPELLPTLLVREAYGTRARDTDWMDGFYPYHEMDAYLGVVGLALAALGAAARRDRWVGGWVVLGAVGGVLMLGRFTAAFDLMPLVPIVGKSRIPVRYHLWVTAAASALAAVGADRLARPGPVRLRGAVGLIAGLAAASIPIALYVYWPAITDQGRWATAYHRARYAWLGRELAIGSARSALVAVAGALAAWGASRSSGPGRRARIAAALPLLILVDLAASHRGEVPTIDPAYWTDPPPTVAAVKSDPAHGRVFGIADLSAGEPGYASEGFDAGRFLRARDALGWSLAPVWGLDSAAGETPIHPRRFNRYGDAAILGRVRFDVEGVTHVVSGFRGRIDGWPEPVAVGSAHVLRNPRPLPRARLVGRPTYARGEDEAVAALRGLGGDASRLVVEDPGRPLAPGAVVADGSARIVEDRPERVVVEARASSPSYLVLADALDPGWSAEVDGRPAPIRPAYVAFRAVYLPAGPHRVAFSYEPAGFRAGGIASAAGLALAAACAAIRRPVVAPSPAHADRAGRPIFLALAVSAIVGGSAVSVSGGRLGVHGRWADGLHAFTWGSGIEAMLRERARESGTSAPLTRPGESR